MIKAVILDIDNTLMDFMRMKRAAVDSAVDDMIDAGLNIPKEEMVEKIFKISGKKSNLNTKNAANYSQYSQPSAKKDNHFFNFTL